MPRQGASMLTWRALGHIMVFPALNFLTGCVTTACYAGAGRVKTEIVHFLSNTFTLHKFRDQRQVLGSELDLTDFDEAEMSVQSVLDFMAQARADNKSPAAVSLRAREGTTFNLLRLYGESLHNTDSSSPHEWCLLTKPGRAFMLSAKLFERLVPHQYLFSVTLLFEKLWPCYVW